MHLLVRSVEVTELSTNKQHHLSRAPSPKFAVFKKGFRNQNDFDISDRCKREYRQYRTWVEAGK